MDCALGPGVVVDSGHVTVLGGQQGLGFGELVVRVEVASVSDGRLGDIVVGKSVLYRSSKS